MSKQQVFYVHGGMTFKNREAYLFFLKNRPIKMGAKLDWSRSYLSDKLGGNIELTSPRMPLQDYANYEDWKIWFDRHIPYMKDGVVLVGSSLGGIFLAQYLSENKVRVHIEHTYLVAPPFDDEVAGEDLVGGFELSEDLSLLQKQAGKLTLMFSRDDEVVPIEQMEKYKAKLPNAEYIVYESKGGHFQVEEFPELVEMIKQDLK